ncbi:MAG: SET domain-containing protein-lysine N-methyltransferase [Steroidobacteraceae bacterium]
MSPRVKVAAGPLYEVRHSPIHGHGVFARRLIRKGTRIVEYLGERISHEKANTRYEDKDPNDNHTFLFTVDERTVIDAAVGGNAARFINHGCDPNCESTTERRRVFIDAIRTIQPGEELNYDYSIQRDADDPANVDEIFACCCRAAGCRGSMLESRPEPKRRARPAKRTAKRRTRAAAKRAAKPAATRRTKRAAKRPANGSRGRVARRSR